MKRIDEIIESPKAGLPEAMDNLKELALRAPHNVKIFEIMLNLAVQLGDAVELLEAPDSASIQHNLAVVEIPRGNIKKARNCRKSHSGIPSTLLRLHNLRSLKWLTTAWKKRTIC